MIICCHTEITRQWSEDEFHESMMLLPADLRDAAWRKKQWRDRQLFIAGKLLLKEALYRSGREYLSLYDLKYNSHKRPYFDADIDFNISHSGNAAVCCLTDKGHIGIDIELVRDIHLADYPDYFSENEWTYIDKYPGKFDGFYNLWTRKEAVLKAIGTGFHTPLSEVDVATDQVSYQGIVYFIRALDILPNYKCHIATTAGSNNIASINVQL